MTKNRIITAVAITAAAASAASATMTPAQPFTLDQDSAVAVQFVSQSAGARGNLYFIGFEQEGEMFNAVSSDANELGQFIFQNHGTSAGTTVELGEFGAGSTLHFAYLVTNGAGGAPTGSLFRTDFEADANYFAIGDTRSQEESLFTRLGIEDIRDPQHSDFDYNDLVVDVRTTPIPAPGSVALAMTALAMIARRRK